jgi:hypothetical protein
MSLNKIKARIVKGRNGDVLITGFSVNPHTTPKEAQRAGDLIDALLEQQASSAGISSLLMMIHGQDECEEVRTYAQNAAMQGVGRYNTISAANYLN